MIRIKQLLLFLLDRRNEATRTWAGRGTLRKLIGCNDWDQVLFFLFSCFLSCILLALYSVDPLSSPVGMSYLNLLKQVLDMSNITLEANTLKPLVVLLNYVFNQLVLLNWLLLTNWQLTHQLICELALPFSLAVLTKEEGVLLNCLIQICLSL